MCRCTIKMYKIPGQGTVEALFYEIFVPTTLEGGGTKYSNGFFVPPILADQTILADRYFGRREL